MVGLYSSGLPTTCLSTESSCSIHKISRCCRMWRQESLSRGFCMFLLSKFLFVFLLVQQPVNMPGVENSVGYLAGGTSIEPRTTSESESMIHTSFGNWTAMFHANAFVSDIQQSGPRGGDKLFSTNWFMPMLTRQF